MIASILNSKHAAAALESICLNRLGKKLTLKKYLDIRFLGVSITMGRVIRLWECIQELHTHHYEKAFPLEEYKVEIFQIFILLEKIKHVQEHAQTEIYPVACTTLLKLVELRHELLPNKPIVGDSTTIPVSEINPHVKVYRQDLLESVDKRYFNRFRNGVSRGSGKPAESFLLEMTTVMHPAYKKLSFLDAVLESMGIDPVAIKDMIKNKVIDLAIRIANAVLADQNADDGVAARVLDFADQPDAEIDQLADEFDALNFNSGTDDVRTLITLEFDKYMHEAGVRSRAAQADILDWWRERTRKYPYLSEVARCLLSTEASAGFIELDFSIGGHYADMRKMGLSNENMEMKLFIKRNLNFLDWNRIVKINVDTMTTHMPQQPAVPFVENEEEIDIDYE